MSLLQKNELGEVIASVYVDDIFSIGDKEAVEDIISILKNISLSNY